MKRAIICEEAPIPIGPFSQAIIAQGEVLFVSGTIGLTNDGKLTEGLKNQAEQILKNIGAVLLQAEYTFAHVVKVNVF
jgi:2-iminobutanoate/2-iminopropanoate deaminase